MSDTHQMNERMKRPQVALPGSSIQNIRDDHLTTGGQFSLRAFTCYSRDLMTAAL